MLKIGFIGAGNMGYALAKAVKNSAVDTRIYISNRTKEKAEKVASELGILASTNEEIAENGDIIFFAVKPNILPKMIDGIKGILSKRNNFTVVSMAAGINIEKLTSYLGFSCPIIRIMPNTPVSIGEGMTLWCANELVCDKTKALFNDILEKSGILDEINESLIDAGSAVSGCGPAFVYMFIEAFSDGAVECGLSREKAQNYAVQTLIGASSMVSKSGMHPEKLKDAVCSPGGSTIAGVHALENGAFRATVMNAVKASFDKTKKLGDS